MAAGNVGALYACVDSDAMSTFLVYSGRTILPVEGKKGDKDLEVNHLTEKEVINFERVGSLPYKIAFDIPVSQVLCGDLFCALVTAHGSMYTWGCNEYG